MQGPISNVLIDQEALSVFYTITGECCDIRMSKSGHIWNSLKKIIFLLQRHCCTVDLLDGKYLQIREYEFSEGVSLERSEAKKERFSTTVGSLNKLISVHYLPIWELSLVNPTKRAFSNEIFLTKVVCSNLKSSNSIWSCSYRNFRPSHRGIFPISLFSHHYVRRWWL